MRILAVDSSTWWGGVALVEQKEPSAPCRTVIELGLHVPSSHAAKIVAAIEAALSLAGWNRGSLDLFVATRGPGSFTGVRIGLGTVRGLGLAADRPTAGVSTLDALAEANGPAEGERLSLISAGRGEIFGARYPASSSPAVPVGGPWLLALDRWSDLVRNGGVAIPASGSESAVRDALLATPGVRISKPPFSVAAAAGCWAARSGGLDRSHGDTLTPIYMRPPDAELKSPAP